MNLISGGDGREEAHLEASDRPTDWTLMAVCLLQPGRTVIGLIRDSHSEPLQCRGAGTDPDPLTPNLLLSVSMESGGNSIDSREDFVERKLQ